MQAHQISAQILCAFVVFFASPKAVYSKPNIVFILADDLGYGEAGFNGQKKIATPNLDRMAREGMVFTHHYAGNAVCAPSRAVLMTGRNPGHAVIRDNRDADGIDQMPLPADTPTIATQLKLQGYATGAFGKWGLGSMESSGSPLKQGFDHFVGITSQRHAHSHYPAFIWKNHARFVLRNGESGVPGHAAFPPGRRTDDPAAYTEFTGNDFCSDHFIAGAEGFIANHATAPFFLYYASPLPHVSLQVPEEDLKPYQDSFPEDPPFAPTNPSSYVPNRTPRATYAAMITRLDAEVGRILKALRNAGVERNTLVIFSSDNGPTHNVGGVDTAFFHSAAGLRGLKGSLYEGGVREPTVAYWPGVTPGGVRSKMISGFEDWLPTFAELGGGKLASPHEGESLVPTLQGRDQHRQSSLYREFTGYGHQQSIREGKWKAIRTNMLKAAQENRPPVTELYDMESDPGEERDVAGQFPDMLKTLEEKMTRARVPARDFPLAGADPLKISGKER